MPSFVIDEIHIGDIVKGDVVLRDFSYEERMPEPPREMNCPMDIPVCPDGTMSRGRGPNCEPICDVNGPTDEEITRISNMWQAIQTAGESQSFASMEQLATAFNRELSRLQYKYPQVDIRNFL